MRKTKAHLIAENDALRSKVREVYAAYHDTHKAWEQAEEHLTQSYGRNEAGWQIERMEARITGLLEQISDFKGQIITLREENAALRAKSKPRVRSKV